MKEFKALKLAFLFIITLIMSGKLYAGNLNTQASMGPAAGNVTDSKTSSYISPGSTVNWSINLIAFDMCGGGVCASGGIYSVLGHDLYFSGNYVQQNYQDSGSYTFVDGGTLTVFSYAWVGGSIGYATAYASVTW